MVGLSWIALLAAVCFLKHTRSQNIDIVEIMKNRNKVPKSDGSRCMSKPRLMYGNADTSDRQFATYSCGNEYVLVGQKKSACAGGSWPSLTLCAAKKCKLLSSLMTGPNRTTTVRAQRSVLVFTCDPGTNMTGDPIIYCGGSYVMPSWRGQAPSCDGPTPTIFTTETTPTTQAPPIETTQTLNVTSSVYTNDPQENGQSINGTAENTSYNVTTVAPLTTTNGTDINGTMTAPYKPKETLTGIFITNFLGVLIGFTALAGVIVISIIVCKRMQKNQYSEIR